MRRHAKEEPWSPTDLKQWTLLRTAVAKLERLQELEPKEAAAAAGMLTELLDGRDARRLFMAPTIGRKPGVRSGRQQAIALVYRILRSDGEARAAETVAARWGLGNRQAVTRLARQHRDYCDGVLSEASPATKKRLLKQAIAHLARRRTGP